MLTLNSLNIEYRGANFSIVYSTINNILYIGGNIESTVSFDITIPWGPCNEGDTVDTYIEIFKKFIDFHHVRLALKKAFD